MVRHILIDCDPGVDDAVALLTAFANEDVKVVALTITHGNTTLENSVRNAIRVLKFCKYANEVKIYIGREDPLTKDLKNPLCTFHGIDGFMDVPNLLPLPPSKQEIEDRVEKTPSGEYVSSFRGIIHTSLQYSDLEIVILGPLTNIAKAVKVDPEVPKRISKVTIMGGSSYETGNVTLKAEFNMYQDPKADEIFFNTYGREMETNVVIITNNTTYDNLLNPDSFNYNTVVNNLKSEKYKPLFAKILSMYNITDPLEKDVLFQNEVNEYMKNLGHHSVDDHKFYGAIHDALAMCVHLDQSIVTKSEFVGVKVGVEPGPDFGVLKIDRQVYIKGDKICIIDELDVVKAGLMIMKGFVSVD